MNKLKTKVIMENDTPAKCQQCPLTATSTLDGGAASEAKEIQRIITAGCIPFTNLKRISSNDIRRGNMDTHQPRKEQTNRCANTEGKKYVKHHIPGQKNKHLGKRKNKVRRRD